MLDLTTEKDLVRDMISKGEQILINFDTLPYDHPLRLGLVYKKLITDAIDVENEKSITNFNSIIEHIEMNKYVASYKWDSKTNNDNHDDYKTFEFFNHLIRDFMYNLFRIKMWFYEMTESYSSVFESILNLVDYFKHDLVNNKEEVLFLLKKAQEMIIGIQHQAIDWKIFSTEAPMDTSNSPLLKLSFDKNIDEADDKSIIDPKMLLHLCTKHI